MSAKSKSACEFDNIHHVVLKFPPVIDALQKLFQLVFDAGIIPSEWRKAVIYPILKDIVPLINVIPPTTAVLVCCLA